MQPDEESEMRISIMKRLLHILALAAALALVAAILPRPTAAYVERMYALQEVLDEGDESQRQQAKQLLDSLPG